MIVSLCIYLSNPYVDYVVPAFKKILSEQVLKMNCIY